jgi:tetratricopeptide (TPR) repeat protein
LAYCYEQTQQLLEAKSLRLKNTQFQPNNGKVFYQLGNVCYKLNDYPAANDALIQAIQLAPNYYPAYLLKGVVSLALQDYGTGKKDLEVALKNLPDKVSDIYPNLAFAAAKLGDLNDALPYLTEWEKLEPQNGLIFYTRGNLYASKFNYHKALENYSKAIELDPNNSDYLLNRAILNINNSHYQNAILDGERILLLNQKTAEVYYNLGVAYIKDGTQLSKGCEAIKTAKRMGYPQAEQWLSKCD